MFSDVTPDISLHAPPRAPDAIGIACDCSLEAGLIETLLSQNREPMLLAESWTTNLSSFRIVYANPAFVQSSWGQALCGLKLPQALSTFHPAFAEPSRLLHLQSLLAAGLPVRGEILIEKQELQPRGSTLDILPLSTAPHSPLLWLLTLRDASSQTQAFGSVMGEAVADNFVCSTREFEAHNQTEAVLSDEQTLVRTLIDSMPDQIYVKDRQGRFLLDNEAHRQMRNVRLGESCGKTVWDFFPPDLARLYDADDQIILRAGQSLLNREEPTLDGDGNRRWMSTTKTPLIGEGGEIVGLLGVSRDITELRIAAEELKQSADKYRILFQANPHPMWVYDTKTLAFLAVNDTAVVSYGYSGEEFLAMTLADIRPQEDLPQLMQDLAYTPPHTHVSGPWRHTRKDGTEIAVDIHSHPLLFNERAARLVVAVNITERQRVQAESEQLLTQTKHLLTEAVERADRDPLTGLLNHRAFHKCLEQEAETAHLCGGMFTVALMDLDNFKFFNDGYGHSVGDDLLRNVTRALSAVCRPGDTLARFGGDEFVLLMPGAGVEEAVRQADHLVASLAGVGYRPPGYDTIIPLTLSIGIAVFPNDGLGRLEVLAAADARLIRVKTGGTGRGELTELLRDQLACSSADFSMLNALVTAVDTKDRYTRRHSEDVMSYSHQIAQEMGLSEKTLQETLLAALLHDVGKIGVPDHVLRKPGHLSQEEFEAIKQHPMMGSIIVGAVPGFEATLDAIRHHHERWDGLGYPFGLQGEDIPLMARVMAVADAFSAMTTDRPYRKGMNSYQALSILDEGAGTQWDPACVTAFRTAHRKLNGLDDWFEE